MEMALVHTINAFSWPLLFIAVLLILWKIGHTLLVRHRGPDAPDSEKGAAVTGRIPGGTGTAT